MVLGVHQKFPYPVHHHRRQKRQQQHLLRGVAYIESPRGKSCFSVCFSNNREAWRLFPGWMERDGAKRVDCKWWSTDLLTTTDINLTFFDSTPTSIFGKGRRPASSYLSTSEMSRTSTERMQSVFASATPEV